MIPINLPGRVVTNQPITATWANAIREAIWRLSKRLPAQPGGVGGGGSSSYIPWDPQFTQEGTEPSIPYKARFNLGTLNNVAASNWDTEHTLPSGGDLRFVILNVTSADGKITGLTISLQAGILDEDFVAKDTPPTSHKILLGVVSNVLGSMIENTNLNAVAEEVYRESKVAPAVGAEPFSRWWRWNHTKV